MAPRLHAAACAVLMLVAGMASASRAGLVSFRRLAIPDEVPAHLTTALAQDRQGFLWIGVTAGRIEDPKAALRRFKDDPEGSTAKGEMRVLAAT